MGLRRQARIPGHAGSVESAVDLLHMSDEVKHLVGVADLIVIPGNDLHECVGKSDSGLRVEDGCVRIPEEVGGDDCILSIAEDSLELALGSLLHSCADLVILRRLSEVDSEIDDGDIKSRNPHRHACELAVE